MPIAVPPDNNETTIIKIIDAIYDGSCSCINRITFTYMPIAFSFSIALAIPIYLPVCIAHLYTAHKIELDCKSLGAHCTPLYTSTALWATMAESFWLDVCMRYLLLIPTSCIYTIMFVIARRYIPAIIKGLKTRNILATGGCTVLVLAVLSILHTLVSLIANYLAGIMLRDTICQSPGKDVHIPCTNYGYKNYRIINETLTATLEPIKKLSVKAFGNYWKSSLIATIAINATLFNTAAIVVICACITLMAIKPIRATIKTLFWRTRAGAVEIFNNDSSQEQELLETPPA